MESNVNVDVRLIIMQTEDGVTSLEMENRDVLHYTGVIPEPFKEGDIVRAIVHSEEDIEFLCIDEDATEEKRRRREARRLRFLNLETQTTTE